MIISHNPEPVMKEVANEYRLKDGYSKPDAYLGAELEEFTVQDGDTSIQAWSFKSVRYVKNLVSTVGEMLESDGRSLRSHAETPSQPMGRFRRLITRSST